MQRWRSSAAFPVARRPACFKAATIATTGCRSRRRTIGLGQYLRPVRRSLSSATQRWLLVLLLFALALINLCFRPSQMPQRTTGLVEASDGVMAVGAAGTQGNEAARQRGSGSNEFYSGTSRTLSFTPVWRFCPAACGATVQHCSCFGAEPPHNGAASSGFEWHASCHCILSVGRFWGDVQHGAFCRADASAGSPYCP